METIGNKDVKYFVECRGLEEYLEYRKLIENSEYRPKAPYKYLI